MTARAIKIDKRLPCFIGGRAGVQSQTGCERRQRKTCPSRSEAPFSKLRINSHAIASLLNLIGQQLCAMDDC